MAQLSEEKKLYSKKPDVQPPYRYVADTKHNVRYGVLLPQQEADELNQVVERVRKGLEPKSTPILP